MEVLQLTCFSSFSVLDDFSEMTRKEDLCDLHFGLFFKVSILRHFSKR